MIVCIKGADIINRQPGVSNPMQPQQHIIKKSQNTQLNTYKWSGLNCEGSKITGKLRGHSITAIKTRLRRQGIQPITVKKYQQFNFNWSRLYPLTTIDIAIFTRQIATMLQAGICLVTCLTLIRENTSNKQLQQLIQALNTKIQAGIALSETLSRHPKYFNRLYCDLVLSAEQSGKLDTVFLRLAEHQEKVAALKSKIKKALYYPCAVLIISSIVTGILLIWIVPQFVEIFSSFNATLPNFTLLVINIAHHLHTYWWQISLMLFICLYSIKQAYRHNTQFQHWLDSLLIKTPIISPIITKLAIARFTRTLYTTFSANVPLIDALYSAAGATSNRVFYQAILSIRHQVSAGDPINTAMQDTGRFPPMVIQMIAIGEHSGQLDTMLDQIATQYETDLDETIDGLTTLIEPIIMVILGVVIGGLIVAMYLPIFELGKIIK